MIIDELFYENQPEIYMLEQDLPKHIKDALIKFIAEQARLVINRVPISRKAEVKRQFDWTLEYAGLHIFSREKRAEEINSNEVKEARELAREFLGKGIHDFWVTCIDGRVIGAIIASKIPLMAGLLKLPAAKVPICKIDGRPGMVVLTDNYEVERIEKLLLDRKPDEVIFYVLDSHFGCAAGGNAHTAYGGDEDDGGVVNDIKEKLRIAKALEMIRERLIKQGKNPAQIVPVFISYDPHNGNMHEGMEINLHDARVAEHGYTEQVINELLDEGRIINAQRLMDDPEIAAILEENITHRADFRKEFGQTLLNNWLSIASLYNNGKGLVFRKIYGTIFSVYEKGGWTIDDVDSAEKQCISQQTLEHKAKLLLMNLVTHYSIARTDFSEENWEFAHHREGMVVITEGGFPPFDGPDAFGVYAHSDPAELVANIKLALGLIRGSRAKGGAKNPVEKYQFDSPRKFASVPIVISNKAVLRNVKEVNWQALSKIDLAKIFLQIDMTDLNTLSWNLKDISKLVKEAARESGVSDEVADSLSFIESVFELFHRMSIMMNDPELRTMIVEGKVVVLNTIVDQDRRPRVVLPLAA